MDNNLSDMKCLMANIVYEKWQSIVYGIQTCGYPYDKSEIEKLKLKIDLVTLNHYCSNT